MNWKKRRLKDAKLYVILDAEVLDAKELLSVLKDSVRNGVDVVQLRNKFGNAKDILDFCQQALKITRGKIPFILNDRLDLAVLAKADGVHVGQEDVCCRDARKFLGENFIIGVSCQTLGQARIAQRQGADYIGFGSVFKTKTKPERNPMDLDMLRTVLDTVDVPVFPIGGISRSNISSLQSIGATRAAVCRDILLSSNRQKAIQGFLRVL